MINASLDISFNHRLHQLESTQVNRGNYITSIRYHRSLTADRRGPGAANRTESWAVPLDNMLNGGQKKRVKMIELSRPESEV